MKSKPNKRGMKKKTQKRRGGEVVNCVVPVEEQIVSLDGLKQYIECVRGTHKMSLDEVVKYVVNHLSSTSPIKSKWTDLLVRNRVILDKWFHILLGKVARDMAKKVAKKYPELVDTEEEQPQQPSTVEGIPTYVVEGVPTISMIEGGSAQGSAFRHTMSAGTAFEDDEDDEDEDNGKKKEMEMDEKLLWYDVFQLLVTFDNGILLNNLLEILVNSLTMVDHNLGFFRKRQDRFLLDLLVLIRYQMAKKVKLSQVGGKDTEDLFKIILTYQSIIFSAELKKHLLRANRKTKKILDLLHTITCVLQTLHDRKILESPKTQEKLKQMLLKGNVFDVITHFVYELTLQCGMTGISDTFSNLFHR